MKQCPSGIGETDSRDPWAERLAQNAEMAPDTEADLKDEDWEDEDWTEDVPEEELKPLETFDEDPVREVDLPKKKHIWPLVLCLVMALLTAGFWIYRNHIREAPPIPGSGYYLGCTKTFQGVTQDNRYDWVELKNDNTFEMCLLDNVSSGRWRMDQDRVFLRSGSKEILGHLDRGVLTIEDADITFVFALPGSETLAKGEILQIPVTVPPEEDPYEDWAGDYYGTMVLTDCTGGWSGSEGERAAVCGQIKLEEDGTGELRMWNENNKPGEWFLMANVAFSEGTKPMGKMHVQWGKLYDMELGPGEWVVDPGKSPVCHFEDMLYIRGRFLDVQETRSGFTYEIYLRPWGKTWEDVMGSPASILPQEDILPPNYEKWYLPLVEDGKWMPEYF